MRYTHTLKIVRHKRHRVKISLVLTGILILLIGIVGFTALDASSFFVGFFESFVRVGIAYILALITAVLIALLISFNEKVEGIVVPVLDVLQSFPSFALFPLLVVWFGKSSLVTILILFVSMIWPILFTVHAAQKSLPGSLLEAGKIYGATGWKHLFFVLSPLLSTAVVTGSIVAWGEAWETIIAAEIIVNISGVGTYLASLGQAGQSKILIVGIFALLAILFVVNKFVWLPLLSLSTRYQQD